jgi:tripartite-type tricarboxylate transporter receptor subunit TctC
MGVIHFPARKYRLLALAVAALLATGAAACSSGSGSTSSGSGGGATGVAFYKGKTINVVVNPPGNTLYGEMQLLAPQMAKYLGATMKLVSVPGASVVAQNEAAAAEPDGLTIGILSTLSNISTIYFDANQMSFGLQKLSIIGSFPRNANLMAVCKGSSFKTLNQVLTSKSTVTVLDTNQSTNSLLMHLIFRAYGTPVKYIEGYTPTSAGTGCIRGDGQIYMGPPPYVTNAAGSAMTPGIIPLLLTRDIPSDQTYSWLDKTPTITQYETAHPPTHANGSADLNIANVLSGDGSGDTLFAPPGTPADRVAALTAALKAAMKSSTVTQGLIKLTVDPRLIAPNVTATWLAAANKQTATVQAAVGKN